MRHIYHLFFLALTLLVVCNCSPKKYEIDQEWTKKIDSPELTYAIQHYLSYLRHEKHLRLEDTRIYYNSSINTIRMEFTSQDILELREARFLIVDLVEGLLAELNRNPILGPQFITYPLTADQLEIYISYDSFYGLIQDPYFVGYIQLEEGIVTYYAFDTKYTNQTAWSKRKEPYFKTRELAIYEREAEEMFKETMDMQKHSPLKEQYISPDKEIPRYFSPHKPHYIFKD